MINSPNKSLMDNVEVYFKILGGVVTMPLESEVKFNISLEVPLEERKAEIENYIFQLFDKVNDVNSLSFSLFIFRSVMKEKMYDDDLNFWTIRFKICNYLFFLSLKYLQNSKHENHVTCNESKIIKNIYSLGYTFFENQCLFNQQYFLNNKNLTDKFFNEVIKISNMSGDLHSYKITNSDLQNYLDMKNITIDIIKENALDKYKEIYISKAKLSSKQSYINMISHDNISNSEDDIIIIPIDAFNKYDKQFQNFITSFEVEKCKSPSDPESELIFSYKYNNYFYISKKMMSDTQTIIENFITWGQYENITNYFFGTTVNQKTLKDYNRLMTYKIADLLLANGYIVPMESVKGMSIPRIEISNYIKDKRLKNELGDIDLIFYSEHTKILYLIEYKNYQMMVSRDKDLSAEVSKVKREKTPEKVNKRQRYVCSNIEYCKDTLFKNKNIGDILNIKSIILTTKPCYYFYINKSENYEYMEWIEFKSKVLERKL